MIITFYSYKGGTGRTMAMANIAWLLAARGKKVLAVDFPGPGGARLSGEYFSRFYEGATGAERTDRSTASCIFS